MGGIYELEMGTKKIHVDACVRVVLEYFATEQRLMNLVRNLQIQNRSDGS